MKPLSTWLALIWAVALAGCTSGSGSASPADISSNVEDGEIAVPVNQAFTFTFAKDLDTSTITASSFFVNPIALEAEEVSTSKGSYDATLCNAAAAVAATIACGSLTQCTLTPNEHLALDTRYALCLSEEISYVDGYRYPGTTITFTTEEAPAISSVSPADGATGVALNVAVEITFSRAMDPVSINEVTIALSSEGGGLVNGAVSLSADGKAATFEPRASLDSYRRYIATVSGDVTDERGNPMGSPFSWSFVTSDVIAPTVVATDPADGATGIVRESAVSATFNEEMDPATITTSTFTVSSSLFGVVDGAVSYDAATKTATFTPASSLFGLTTLSLTLTTGITDAHGIPLAQSASASFRTARAKIAQVGSGYMHTVALAEDGTVWAWGYNAAGQLGNGSTTSSITPVHVSDLTGVASVAAFGSTSFALKADGTAWGWGYNSYGQLGNGTKVNSSVPVQVVGLLGAVEIAVGGSFALARLEDDSLVAWGNNAYGQLGDGTNTERLTPAPVIGIADVAAVAAGSFYALAMTADGSAYAWGYNALGQLGIGNTDNKSTPTKISSLANVTALSAKCSTSFALSDSEVYAWGYNVYGQLGIGNRDNQSSPTRVGDLSDITNIAGGCNSALAFVEGTGTAWSWGNNFYGQLGDGKSGAAGTTAFIVEPERYIGAYELSPMAAVSLASLSLKQIETGYYGTTILGTDGNVRMLGDNRYSQLGSSAVGVYGRTPHLVEGLSDVRAVGQATSASFAITGDDGKAWAWGSDSYGILGIGTVSDNQPMPMPICAEGVDENCAENQLSGVKKIEGAPGRYGSFAFALKEDDTLVGWGRNNYGFLGHGDATIPYPYPVPVCAPTGCPAILTRVSAFSAGNYNTFALADHDGDERNELYGWGNDTLGNAGNGTTQDAVLLPTRVVKPTKAADAALCHEGDLYLDQCVETVAVGTTSYGGYALDSEGFVWAWGDNSAGQLGQGTTDSTAHPSPMRVLGPDGVNPLEGIAALFENGGNCALVVKNDGTVWGWGQNSYATLGDGTKVTRTLPVQIVGITNPTRLVVGFYSSAAVMADGSIFAWGDNSFGQLADGTSSERLSPQASPLLDGLSFLNLPWYHGIGIKEGKAYEFGFNAANEDFSASTSFADDTYPYAMTPVDVIWPE